MRILHAFKIYRPELEGGVPEVIGLLTGSTVPNVENRILVARRFGWGYERDVNKVPVKAVASLGDLFSMPIAPTFPFALARAARNADVVVLHAPFPLNDIGIMLGIPAYVRLVVHWHSDILGRRVLVRLLAPIIRRTLARADRIVVSNSSIISLSSFLKEYRDKCVVIPFGVDPDYWGQLSQSEQAEVERFRTLHPRLIVATGRLVRYKGFDVLIRALREVDGTALIVGDGPQEHALRRLAGQLGVGQRLIIAGSVPRGELKIFLHAARVFAFPSITSAETFGIAQLEAMAVGLPVVNTALLTGVPLVARHGRESLTVAPNDPSALAAAINRLLDDPALAAELGQAGHRRVNEEFHHRAFVRRVMVLYDEVNSGCSGAERSRPRP